ILFEAITGQKAFTGKDNIEVLNKIIREPAPQLAAFNPNAPADLQRIVRRCLAKDPEQRYQNIKDVAIELKEVRRELQERSSDTTVPPVSSTTSHDARVERGVYRQRDQTAQESRADRWRTRPAGRDRCDSRITFLPARVKHRD